MGEPVTDLDLARDLVRLAGRDPETQPIEIIGLRPGEKLHEELFYEAEEVEPTEVDKILRAIAAPPPPAVRTPSGDICSRSPTATDEDRPPTSKACAGDSETFGSRANGATSAGPWAPAGTGERSHTPSRCRDRLVPSRSPSDREALGRLSGPATLRSADRATHPARQTDARRRAPGRGPRRRPRPRAASSRPQLVRRPGQDRERAVVDRHDVLDAEQLDGQRGLRAGPS